MTQCPWCHGEGVISALVSDAADACRLCEVSCPMCRGSGEIAFERAEAVERGAKLRAYRLEKGLTQRQAAALMGCSVEELSKREVGLLS